MSRYREIYHQIEMEGMPCVDDLLREAGVEARGHDLVQEGMAATLVYLAEKIQKLEKVLKDA